jgi:hypothetical protein
MGVMKRLATGARMPRIRTGRYGMGSDGFHVDFSMFVDRKGVMDRIDRKVLRILSGTGAYAMGAMRKSIRSPSKSKKSRTIQVGDTNCFIPEGRGKVLDAATGRPVPTKVAQLAHINFRERTVAEGVGRPPKRGPSDLLRKRIFFGVETETESVVIGPEMFAAQPRLVGAVSVPQLLDQGGQEEVRFGGRPFLARYEPRPFVGPTLPIAQRRMEELTEEIPL